MAHTPLDCVTRPCRARFQQRHFDVEFLQGSRHVPVAAADIQEHPVRRIALHDRADARVAMPEPEGIFLQLETDLVSSFRVGNAGDLVADPGPVRR